MSIKALERHLELLSPHYQQTGVTEVCLNQPLSFYIEQHGKFHQVHDQDLDTGYLTSLAALFAEYNHQDFPLALLGGTLPNGERMQWVFPPVAEKGNIIFSLRRHQMKDLTLADYVKAGSFTAFKHPAAVSAMDVDAQLTTFYEQGDVAGFLSLAVQAKKTILISGGTGTGKTTFLNALVKCIPLTERIITVEDTLEVSIPHPNHVRLKFFEDDPHLNALNIFKTCLRLRPDRIFLSELRTHEAWSYLRAANSGHPGSLSTIHADTPEGAFTQLVFMMQQAGSTSTEEQLRHYIKMIIPIVVQLKKSTKPGCFTEVSDIYYSGLAQQSSSSTFHIIQGRTYGSC